MTSRRLVLTRGAALVGAASTSLLLPSIARAQSNKVRVGLMLPCSLITKTRLLKVKALSQTKQVSRL